MEVGRGEASRHRFIVVDIEGQHRVLCVDDPPTDAVFGVGVRVFNVGAAKLKADVGKAQFCGGFVAVLKPAQKVLATGDGEGALGEGSDALFGVVAGVASDPHFEVELDRFVDGGFGNRKGASRAEKFVVLSRLERIEGVALEDVALEKDVDDLIHQHITNAVGDLAVHGDRREREGQAHFTARAIGEDGPEVDLAVRVL